MRQITPYKYNVGRYYIIFRKANGLFKRVSILKYDSIFSDIESTLYNLYKNFTIITSHNIHAPIEAHDDVLIFELDDEEEFKHIMMELITQNL